MVKLEVISTPIKRLEQQDILVVKLEVIGTPIKRLEQQVLLMVKLAPVVSSECLSPPV
jgi:hypothetical protein